jgi:hypothetical protein
MISKGPILFYLEHGPFIYIANFMETNENLILMSTISMEASKAIVHHFEKYNNINHDIKHILELVEIKCNNLKLCSKGCECKVLNLNKIIFYNILKLIKFGIFNVNLSSDLLLRKVVSWNLVNVTKFLLKNGSCPFSWNNKCIKICIQNNYIEIMKLFPKREISSYESVNLLFKMCLEMKNENIIILFINKFYNYLTKGNIKMLILNGCHKVLNNLLLNLKSLKNRLILILKEIRIEMLNWICQYGDFENIGEIFILLLTEDINKTLLLTYETMYVKLCQIAIKYKKIDIVDIILNYVYKIEHNQTSLLEEILQILETSIKYYDHEIFKKIIKFIKENGYNMYNEIYSYSVLLTCIEHGNEHIFDNLIDVLRLKENSYVTDGI